MARDLQKAKKTKSKTFVYRAKSGRASHVALGSESHLEVLKAGEKGLSPSELRQLRRTYTPPAPKDEVPMPKAKLIVPKQVIRQYGKTVYTIAPGADPGEYLKRFPGATQKWQVSYGPQGKRSRTFGSEASAQKFIDDLSREVETAAHRATESGFNADQRAYDIQIANIKKLIKLGYAERIPPKPGSRFGQVIEPAKIGLTIPAASLTDEVRDIALKAGFNIPELPDAPSFRLFEWGQEATKKGTFTRSQTEYYASVIGAGEKAITGLLNVFIKAVKGKPVRYRSVSKDTIGMVKSLSPQEKAYLHVGAVGGTYLGGYVSTIPVGTAISGILGGARSIASAAGVSTPSAIAKIASKIAAHPQLAKAVVWAPIAGVEVSKVYNDFEAGKPVDDILAEESIRVGALLGQIHGLETGFKLPGKVRDWWRTRGRVAIPPDELFRAVTLETGALPTYEGTWRKSWSSQFKKMAKELTAEEYLGKLAHDEYRVWHGKNSPFPYKGGEPWPVEFGDSLGKFPGLFVSAEPSPLRLPGGVGSGSRLGLPGVGDIAELATIDALVEVMPSGMSRAATQKWLTQQVGTGTAYIPPVSMITPEIEAIIPPESMLVKTGESWYTNWAGHRVLVNQYVMIPVGTPLSALPKGFKPVSLSSLTSTSLPISETYLTYGIIPTTDMLSSIELSPTQITALSEYYGISKSDITKLSSTLSKTISSITKNNMSTEVTDVKLSVSDLTSTFGSSKDLPSIYEPTSPKITEPTPSKITEPTPSKITEPTSPPKPPPKAKPKVDLKTKIPARGSPGKYKVTLSYHTKATEVKSVTASNYIDAIGKGVAASRNKRQLIEVEAERIK